MSDVRSVREVAPRNILYSSVFRDGTGYAKAASNFVRKLQDEGHFVQCHVQKLSARDEEPPPHIKFDKLPHYDVCIQHTLPCFWEYRKDLGKNIGLFAYDNSSGLPETWAEHIKMMDEVWVIGSIESENAVEDAISGYKPRIRHIAQPSFASDYEGEFNVLPFRQRLGDDFTFYSVGEFNRRKGWIHLFKCFYTAFTMDDPVQLVCKTDQPDALAKIAAEVREVMGAPNHRPETIIRERLTDRQMLDLHYSCDCYVSCSLGEAWNMPLFDAVAMGKPVVSNYNYGPSLYVPPECIVEREKCSEQACVGQPPFSIRENWLIPDERAICGLMRRMFEDAKFRRDSVVNGLYNVSRVHNMNLSYFLE